jgi:CheY-like chemotaxis protein
MDMMMPVMDGPATIRALTRLNPDLRIICISGLLEIEKNRDNLGSSNIAFLPKPFTAEQLLAELSELLRKPSDLPSEQQTEQTLVTA